MTVEEWKAKGEYCRAGQEARLNGGMRYYGCHYGMRSQVEFARAEFYEGYDEIERALRAAN